METKKKLYGIGSIMEGIELFPVMFSSSKHNHPTEFEWDSNTNGEHLIFMDNDVLKVSSYKNKFKFAWLLEPECLIPKAYKFVKNNLEKFDLIFTHNERILKMTDRAKFVPLGGMWIEPEHRYVQEKTKLNSFLFSDKNGAPGHRLRHEIAGKFSGFDKFGKGARKHLKTKTTALKDYMFSITVENTKEDYWFTEKILDCFAVGTIPIYWGCPSIGDFFDTNGILIFDNIDELESILNNLTPELYYDKLESVKINYEKSKRYWIADDLIYSYLKESNLKMENI